MVALATGGAQCGGVGAAGRLGDAEGLQPELAGGDLRQVALLLVLGAVAQHRAHDIHLGVAGGAVAALALDFHDHRRRRERQAGAAVFLGDQRREEAAFREPVTNSVG